MAFGPTGDATCLRLCARLSIPANARACPHIKPSRRPFRLSALCSNRVEQLPWLFNGEGLVSEVGTYPSLQNFTCATNSSNKALLCFRYASPARHRGCGRLVHDHGVGAVEPACVVACATPRLHTRTVTFRWQERQHYGVSSMPQ